MNPVVSADMKDYLSTLDMSREHFFMCHLTDGQITDPELLSVGNRSSVPAIIPMSIVCREASIVVVHNHPSGGLEPSDSDVLISSDLARRGILSAIIDNLGERVRMVTFPAAAQYSAVGPFDVML